MAITISGLKTGPFRHLEYVQVAQLPKESSAFNLKSESLTDFKSSRAQATHYAGRDKRTKNFSAKWR